MKENNLKKEVEAVRAYIAARGNHENAVRLYSNSDSIYARPSIERAKANLASAKDTVESVLAASPAQATLSAANGRARARVLNLFDVCNALLKVEADLRVTKKAMHGVSVYVDMFAQRKPNSYDYPMRSTHFRADYRRDHWVLTDAHRDDVITSGKGYRVTLTDAARAEILRRHECY